MMSPGLQGEVAWQVNEKWLAKISFLDGSPRALLVQAAMALNPMIFAPGDNAPCGFLYLINRGAQEPSRRRPGWSRGPTVREQRRMVRAYARRRAASRRALAAR